MRPQRNLQPATRGSALLEHFVPSGFAPRSILVLALLGVACGPDQAPRSEQDGAIRSGPPIERSRTLILGDVEAKEPVLRIRRIQPLANWLSRGLAEHGIENSKVVVARDLTEMSRFLVAGEVDLYLDSPLPTLAVQESAGSRVLLRRWARGDPEYWSVFVALKENDIRSLDDLRGGVVAFQERDSTSGFLLPGSSLVELGYRLRTVGGPEGLLEADEIGCFFSGDEENALEAVISGRVDAAVLSNQDLDEIPPAIRGLLVEVGRTPPVPRQLVSVRADLDPELVDIIKQLLLDISDADRQEMAEGLAGKGWTWKFDELPAEAQLQMERFAEASARLSVP